MKCHGYSKFSEDVSFTALPFTIPKAFLNAKVEMFFQHTHSDITHGSPVGVVYDFTTILELVTALVAMNTT